MTAIRELARMPITAANGAHEQKSTFWYHTRDDYRSRTRLRA
jgi:hypothetical protein